jgi:AraC-like DNA-binding protein
MLTLDEMDRLWELRVAGYSLQEIAQMTGYPPSTVAKAIKAFEAVSRRFCRNRVLDMVRMRARVRAQERTDDGWEEDR